MMCRGRICACAAAALLAYPLMAGTWYADAARPSDDGDGLTPATAKRFIQSAVDLAEASGDAERIVKVAPGVYAEGVQEDATGGKSRVVISKALTLASTGGRDATFIDGAPDASDANGLGAAAVRGVFVRGTASGAVIRGFTFRKGATSKGASFSAKAAGGAVAFDGAEDAAVYVKDCAAIDCAASFGGAFSGVVAIRSLAKRCRNDGSGGRGSALYGCKAYCCVFDACGSPTGYGEYILRGNGPYVNCTAVGSSGSLLRTSKNQRVYNTLSCLATRQEFDSASTGGDYAIMGYVQGTNAFAHVRLVNGATQLLDLLLSPLTGDYRPVQGGPADGFGDPQYCGLGWIPEADRGLDYNGAPFDVSGGAGSIHCGAVQTAAAAQGGAVVWPRVLPTTGGDAVQQNVHARTNAWPGQVWIPVAADVFAVTNGLPGVPARFPSAGGFWQTIPESERLTLVPVPATAQLAVGPGEAYADIQAAVDAASGAADAFTVITVAPGTYGPVSVSGKNVFIRSSGGKAVTAIRGVKDADAADGNAGCGPAAKRCVTITPGDRLVALVGFTLAGGATGVWDGATGTETSGESWGDAAKAGGFFVAADKAQGFDMTRVQLLDSDVVDCAGGNAAAVWGGWLQRCAIRGSAQPKYGNAVVRQAILSSCLLTENAFENNQILANGTEANACTILASAQGAAKAVASVTSYLQGMVVCGGRIDKATPTVGSVFFGSVGEIAVTSGYVTDDPLLANPARGVFTPLAGSSAVGRWDVAQKAAGHLQPPWKRLVDDFEGRPMSVVDGRATAGAFQSLYRPKAVYVDAARPDDGGDGLTPATAKRTLAEAGALAACGDTIHVAAGVYADGTMEQTAAVRAGTAPFAVAARVVVPARAALVGAGAATTTVRGGYAAEGAGALVRCVVLGAGAQLRGVTVSGGLCQTAGDETDDGSAAGVLADATAVVEDCVVENCRSRQYGAAVGGTFRRCVFRGNWAMGEACSVGSLREAENCLFAGNRGDSLLWGYERIDNCTFLYDNVKVNGRRISTFGAAAPGAVVRNSALILSPTSPTPMPALVNCLLPKIGATTWRWAATNGVNATDCLLEKDVEVPEAWAAGWDGRPGATFAGIDGGANAAAPPGTDLAGAQRIQNGTVDVGCYERDWLAAYTAAFARRGVATVTATEGAVYARADGTLVLAPGGRLTAVVDVTADAACAVSAVVTGGALSVSVNGVLKGTLTAAEARLLVGRLVAGDVLTLALDGGAAEAPFLWLVRGGCLIIR